MPNNRNATSGEVAVFSDAHGNYEGLRAMFKHARSNGIQRFFSLGDVVDYGPDPCPCLREVRDHCEVMIMGNHDHACLFKPPADDWNFHALAALKWTKKRISEDPKAAELWKILGSFKPHYEEGNYKFVHGSLRHYRDEYMFPNMSYSAVVDNFSLLKRFAFCGHTHIACVFAQDAAGDITVGKQADFGEDPFNLNDFSKAFVCVGSPGQPRDGVTTGCYLRLNMQSGMAAFQRVEYDHQATANRIRAIDYDGYQERIADALMVGG